MKRGTFMAPMGRSIDATPSLVVDPDQQLLDAVPPFPKAVARAAAACAVHDGVLTASEYEALGACAAGLEGLSALPGLMSLLILRSLTEPDVRLDLALRDLKRTAKGIPEATRSSVLEAAAPLLSAQGPEALSMHARWAAALRVPAMCPSGLPGGSSPVVWLERTRSLVGRVRWPLTRVTAREAVLTRARTMSMAFDDEALRQELERCQQRAEAEALADLELAIEAAAHRAFARATARLRSAADLRQQQELASRLLRTAELLLEQVHTRLAGIADRLRVQNEMFDEDLQSFVDAALNVIELRMTELLQGRPNWTEQSTWIAFRKGPAFAELLVRFDPLRRRYGRLFDLWDRELEGFSGEARMVRRTVLGSVDPRAFAGLVSTQHTAAAFKCALDRVADTTLGLSMLGALGVGVTAVFNGAAAAALLTAALASPAGISVLGVVGLAAAWRALSDPEARKQQLVQQKAADLREKLTRLLAEEGLNHGRASAELLEKFAEVAREHYTPVLIEARVWAMKAQLEPLVVNRVLADTRAFLSPSEDWRVRMRTADGDGVQTSYI